jgi:hypothetical protein
MTCSQRNLVGLHESSNSDIDGDVICARKPTLELTSPERLMLAHHIEDLFFQGHVVGLLLILAIGTALVDLGMQELEHRLEPECDAIAEF